MFAVLSYLLQVNLVLVLLFLAYRCLCVFTTFLQMRRVSLWMVRAGALLFPFVHVSQQEALLASDMLGQLGTWTQAAVAFSPNMIQKGIEAVVVRGWWDYALVVYLTIAVLLLGYFVVQWVSLVSLYRKSRLEYWVDGTRLHILPGQGASFSFFHCIFLYEQELEEKELACVVAHEAAHVRGRHSADILLGQLLAIFCWFNPVAWMLQGETKRLMEFLADRRVLRDGCDRRRYQMQLLRTSCNGEVVAAGCNFNFSHLRSRIVMMNKPRSSRYRALVFVAFFSVFCGLPFTGFSDWLVVSAAHGGLGSATGELQGVWMMRHPDKETPTFSYKLLNKDGRYINLRSYDGGKTFSILRQGTYQVVAPQIYIEHLEQEFGQSVVGRVDIVMTYQVAGNRLHVSFKLGDRVYSEVWERLHDAIS